MGTSYVKDNKNKSFSIKNIRDILKQHYGKGYFHYLSLNINGEGMFYVDENGLAYFDFDTNQSENILNLNNA